MDTHDPLTERIIGCAIEVHRHLGPGLNEPAYQPAMCIELNLQRLDFVREPTFAAVYKGVQIGSYRPDLIIAGTVVVELKCVTALNPVFTAQMLTYLKVTGLHTGLLINFHCAVLRDGVRRVSLSPVGPPSRDMAS